MRKMGSEKEIHFVKVEGQIIDDVTITFDKPLISVLVGGDVYGLEFEVFRADPLPIYANLRAGSMCYKNPEKVGGDFSIQLAVSDVNTVKITNTTGKKMGFWVKAY